MRSAVVEIALLWESIEAGGSTSTIVGFTVHHVHENACRALCRTLPLAGLLIKVCRTPARCADMSDESALTDLQDTKGALVPEG